MQKGTFALSFCFLIIFNEADNFLSYTEEVVVRTIVAKIGYTLASFWTPGLTVYSLKITMLDTNLSSCVLLNTTTATHFSTELSEQVYGATDVPAPVDALERHLS